tara:strand:+ start:403 stop:666 length:264 start_codon:yes stop_codon:yes gene_type:complete
MQHEEYWDAEEKAVFFEHMITAGMKDKLILSACTSDILLLRKISHDLEALCVSKAWNQVDHIQGHITELISDLIDVQEDITDPEEES